MEGDVGSAAGFSNPPRYCRIFNPDRRNPYRQLPAAAAGAKD